jgi:HAD superfamily hydrolase (TIGR01490 family)
MKDLVILDLDGVIVNGQSQQIFLNYVFRKKIVGLFFYCRIYLWFVFYKLGLIKNPKKIMEYAFSFLQNREVKEVDRIVEEFFDEVLYEFIFSEIIVIINEHKSKNRELLIVSNAVDILVKRVALFLEISNYVCTRLEVVNGKFTGRIVNGIVYGKNKVNYTKEFIKKNNLNLNNSYAYADHISDLNFLLMVENPFAINPDRLLFKAAIKNNWPVIRFMKYFSK